jgi:hypothetical protein
LILMSWVRMFRKFEVSNFEFVSDFVLQISNLKITARPMLLNAMG